MLTTGQNQPSHYVVGQKVTKLWDGEAVVTEIRIADDKTVASCNLDIGSLQSTRHRKFLRKIVDLPNPLPPAGAVICW